MVKSIFYKPHEREEDALTHRFLAIFEKLGLNGRKTFLQFSGLSSLADLEEPISVDSQVQLGPKRPDGIIRYSDVVVAFENKVKSAHTYGPNGEVSQLKFYHSHLPTDYMDMKPRLLVMADENVQGRDVIEELLENEVIPKSDVDIVLWQEVHRACLNWLNTFGSEDNIKNGVVSELDVFLIEQLKILLEKMNMGDYTGIETKDLDYYFRVWNQLKLMEDHLKAFVPDTLEMLSRSTTGMYASIFSEFLSFAFANVSSFAFLYISLQEDPGGIRIGISIERRELTLALSGKKYLKKLIDSVEIADDLVLQIGPKEISPDLAGRLEEYSSGTLETDDFFEGHFDLSAFYDMKDLEKKLEISNEKFPTNLVKEIKKFEEVAKIISECLSK